MTGKNDMERKAKEALERFERRAAEKKAAGEPMRPEDVSAEDVAEAMGETDEVPMDAGPQIFTGIVLFEDDEGNFGGKTIKEEDTIDPMTVYGLCMRGAEMMRQAMERRMLAQMLQRPAVAMPGPRRRRGG
jgi:hypothetical protein